MPGTRKQIYSAVAITFRKIRLQSLPSFFIKLLFPQRRFPNSVALQWVLTVVWDAGVSFDMLVGEMHALAIFNPNPD